MYSRQQVNVPNIVTAQLSLWCTQKWQKSSCSIHAYISDVCEFNIFTMEQLLIRDFRVGDIPRSTFRHLRNKSSKPTILHFIGFYSN